MLQVICDCGCACCVSWDGGGLLMECGRSVACVLWMHIISMEDLSMCGDSGCVGGGGVGVVVVVSEWWWW